MKRALCVTLALLAVPLLAGCIGEPADAALQEGGAASDAVGALTVHGPGGILDGDVPVVTSVARLLGANAFEPTLGVTPTGAIFFATVPEGGVAIGFGPGVHRSRDGGLTWEDVSPRLPTGERAPPETNDPYVYVDPDTGRVFQFAMAPILVCTVLSWSDDEGDSWTTNPRGCAHAPPYDHQTMVAAKPRLVQTVGYAKVLHQCVNQIATAQCAFSLDGGLTWSPGTPAFPGVEDGELCGGLHGHLVDAPDGTVYLPKVHCGVVEVAITRDDGLTWQRSVVSDASPLGEADPAMAVDAAGNVYLAFVDTMGVLRLTVSRDAGATWSAPVAASPPGVTTHIPALAAGSEGRIVLAYPGTEDLPDGYATEDAAVADGARWNAYLTLAEDALAEAPRFVTVRATDPSDPIVRGPCGPGRCPGLVDFIDVVVGPDGRPYAAFVDACTGECASSGTTGESNNASEGLLVTLTEGPLLRVA